ncbi:MAG: hypothetical protein IPF65_13400 [Polaromonas sp.]|nr:hypothetical protein [Polaromonas sp.]
MHNYYDLRYQNFIDTGRSAIAAASETANNYLDVKPLLKGKKATRAERDTAFWNSRFLTALPTEAWKTEVMQLALTQYFGTNACFKP